ncbi:hypothetical protein [Corynebacterium amycolatum]|uniref:hypothetical protein n=1 Tax=Corynebacterium amycolatum TaxID=43765 RepID=UPI001CCBB1C1|nr:hypothetical protein [Corynebacterium amycolatum]MCA0444291.1 hypothetical protein [Corynebacterium amycolatum]
MGQLFGIGAGEQVRASLVSSAAGASAMSWLSSLGPEPNFVGNNYAKHLAMTGLEADRLGLWPSISKQMKDEWGVSRISAELARGFDVPTNAAQAMLGILGDQSAFVTESVAKHAALAGGLSEPVADIFNSYFENHFAGIKESIQSVFDNAFKQFDFSWLRKSIFPPNLVDIDPEFTLNDV